jgi:tRNA wybutosine-synthesizing protein 3
MVIITNNYYWAGEGDKAEGIWEFPRKLLKGHFHSIPMLRDKTDRMKKLEDKICEGEVDEEILPIIEKINANPNYFTTSSCAGRITLIELTEIGDKEGAEFLGKWHCEVEVEEIKKAYSKAKDTTTIFLLAQSPIIHVRCKNLESAVELRNIAVESGLKYSTLKSLTLNSNSEPQKIVVEILSSENIHVPIAKNKKMYPSEYYLSFLVENANSALRRARQKLEKFQHNLA